MVAKALITMTVSYTHLDVYKRQGEDEALDAGGLHGSQEDEGTGDVVHVVLEGVLDLSLIHILEGGSGRNVMIFAR